MAMTLEEFLVDHPVDRATVDAHKQRMLDAIEQLSVEERLPGCASEPAE
ncbi:hypothetical protein ACFWHT_08865 [Microbacterium sp. NPDC058342]